MVNELIRRLVLVRYKSAFNAAVEVVVSFLGVGCPWEVLACAYPVVVSFLVGEVLSCLEGSCLGEEPSLVAVPYLA